jgi:hypothetical protein
MYCKECGRKYKMKLFTYSSGSGCLSLTWRFTDKNGTSANRKVTLADARRYLASKDGEHLVNWVPCYIENRWQLVHYVKRTGPNRLRIDGESYEYAHNIQPAMPLPGYIGEGNLTTTFKMRVKGKLQTFDMKNLSLRMAICFFLNNEKILAPFFKGYVTLEEAQKKYTKVKK